MNSPAPLSPETVDALLSAELDGDLEGAARDLGLSASEATAQLGVTPGVEARRAALLRARDLIATRPPLEESIERRLVAGAMATDDLTAVRERHGRHERQWRVLVATGSVAAAIAVIVGISSMNSGTESKSTAVRDATQEHANTSTTPGGVASAPVRNRPDLGDVTGANALSDQAQQLLQRSAADTGGTPTEATSKAVGTATPPQNAGPLDAPLNASSFKAAVPACSTPGARYSFSTAPALIATGTVSGQRVLILIYEGTETPYADVIRVSDCTIIRTQSLG